ncbi:MAG: hypothetical protein ACKOB1_05610 [Planctomycetia bacterium]
MKSDRPLRWLRIAAIATGAIILASCRSLTVPALLPATALTIAADDAEDPSACRPCRAGAARPAVCRSGACPAEACPAPVCLPPPEVPTAVPCLVCDGGDHGAPARPTGRHGLRNLTAGDTVARYRPADAPLDDDDDLSEVRLAASTCACVYAPRFSSVRQVIRPNEETAPIGPRGLANEAHVDAAVDTLPVVARRQKVCLGQARVAQFGLAVEERLPALAVDQADLPEASINADMPVERVREEHPALASRVQTPRIKVGFDVPVAWTCVRGAQVIVDGRAAEVIAADRGTATLRLEEPGRAELTLCKRAGSDTARVGEELDFTIFLLNSGDRALTDITLVDAIPKRLALVPDSAASSLPADISTGTGDDGSVVVTWRLTGTLPPGEGGFVRFRTIVR